MQLGQGHKQPDLIVEYTSESMWAKVGNMVEGKRVTLVNSGTAPLVLIDVSTNEPFSSEFELLDLEPRLGCPEQYVLPPRKNFKIRLGFQPETNDVVQARLKLRSSDPDEPTLEIQLEGNRPSPVLDELAPEFRLTSVDRGSFCLPDYRGKVVRLRLFTVEVVQSDVSVLRRGVASVGKTSAA